LKLRDLSALENLKAQAGDLAPNKLDIRHRFAPSKINLHMRTK